MPVAPPFERAAKRQQNGGEDDCSGQCPPGGKATQDAEERGDRDGGRSGQSVYLAVAVAMQNDARPKEATPPRGPCAFFSCLGTPGLCHGTPRSGGVRGRRGRG